MRKHSISFRLHYEIHQKVNADNLFEAYEKAKKKAERLNKMIQLIDSNLLQEAKPVLKRMMVMNKTRLNIGIEMSAINKRARMESRAKTEWMNDFLDAQDRRLNEQFAMGIAIMQALNKNNEFHFSGKKAMEGSKTKREKTGVLISLNIIMDYVERIKDIQVTYNKEDDCVDFACNCGFKKVIEEAGRRGIR